MMRPRSTTLLGCLFVGLLGCGQSIASPMQGDASTDASAGCSFPPVETAAGSYTLDVVQQLDMVVSGRVVAADIDGDGIDELFDPGPCPHLLRFQNGQYQVVSSLCTDTTMEEDQSWIVEVVDVDGDGNLDVVDFGGTSLRIFLGDGTGAFSMQPEFAIPSAEGDPSQVTAVRVGSRTLLLLGRRGDGQTTPDIMNISPESVCGLFYHATQYTVMTAASPVVGYWYSTQTGIQVSSEIQNLNLTGDILGSLVSDFDMNGTQEVLLANEHGPTLFLTVAPDGTVVNAGQNTLTEDTSGMGVTVLGDDLAVIPDEGAVRVYRYANGGFSYDEDHPLAGHLVPGEMWGCHAEDWLGQGYQSLLCAASPQKNPVTMMDIMMLQDPLVRQIVQGFYNIMMDAPTVERFFLPDSQGDWTHLRMYNRPFEVSDSGDDLLPFADPAHDGSLLALRTSHDPTIALNFTEVVRPHLSSALPVGHSVHVRFRGWTPEIGTQVTLHCGGADQTRQVVRQGAWTHTGLITFGCSAATYDALEIVTPTTTITCPSGPMDRTTWVGSTGCLNGS